MLSILASALVAILVLNTISIEAVAGQTDAAKANKKQDIFKVLLTIDGINHNSGDIVTVVSVNGESKSKLFDDTKTYLTSVNTTDGSGEIIEYVATFPNITVNTGDEYKVCALLVQGSQLFCQTGNNSPALRPEIVDLHIQEQSAIAAPSVHAPSVIETEEEE
jgi:hypothetical protein